MRWKHAHVTAIGLLLLFFGLLTLGSRLPSLTSDEPAHLVAGYSILKEGKEAFWLLPQHRHPPLLNVLNALIFYVEKPRIPVEEFEGWSLDFSKYISQFFPFLVPIERTEFVIRLPTILLTMLLGALVFRWGRELWGKRSGLLALLLLVFDPLMLAHGRLATTDAGTVMLGTWALYLAWRWAEAPSWKLTGPLGLACGLTMVSKGSGILWTIAIVLVVIGMALCQRNGRRALELILQGVWVGFLGFLVVWGVHAFTFGVFQEEFPFPIPAPDYWRSLATQAGSYKTRWVFALGDSTSGGWWWYFPLAFLIKNPIPLLIALPIGLTWVWRRPLSRPRILALGIFVFVYSMAALVSHINIGYRHMLPVHPIIYLVAGAGVGHGLLGASRHWWRYSLAMILGLWYAGGTLRLFGYEIAYFNELIGGPRYGHHYLIDSNIDWGQGYKALRDYLQKHPGPTPQLAYHFWWINPALYNIESRHLFPAPDGSPLVSPFHPPAGRYVISISVLQSGRAENPDMYIWFRQVKPTAEIGYSFFLYDINPPPLRWIAQCSVADIPLSDAVIQRGFGGQSLRQLEFDCLSGWVYPSGGDEPGVYGFHHLLMRRKRTFPFLIANVLEPRDPFIGRHLRGARLSVDMRRYTTEYPPFVLYEQERAPEVPTLCSAVIFPADKVPEPEAPVVPTPIALDGPLTFLGANAVVAVVKENSVMDVETWWQVTEGPITRPASVMGHLLNESGGIIGQNDGLGVPPVVWQPGDIIVQRHRFPVFSDQKRVWLRTGVYWLDTLERWAVMKQPRENVLWIPINECVRASDSGD